MGEIEILTESAGPPVKAGTRWLVTVARPGVGQMGTYPEDVLKETGPVAFPPGTKAFFNHDAKRDVRDMVGTYKDGAFWNDEVGELQAYLTPFKRYASVLEDAGQNIEASIHAACRKDPVTGVVRELVANRANTVDLVAFAGIEGSGLKYQVESLFAAAAAEGEDGKEKENNVEITKEMWDALVKQNTDLASRFDTFIAESKQEIKGKADAEALNAAVATRVEEALASYAEAEEAIDKADILAVQKESLKEAARKGEDITDALKSAVSFAEEARKELTPDEDDFKGRSRANVVVVKESQNSPTTNFRVGRWSRSGDKN